MIKELGKEFDPTPRVVHIIAQIMNASEGKNLPLRPRRAFLFYVKVNDNNGSRSAGTCHGEKCGLMDK